MVFMYIGLAFNFFPHKSLIAINNNNNNNNLKTRK